MTGARRLLGRLERRWDTLRGARRLPTELRIVTYVGHGAGGRVLVRGRVVDDPVPAETLAGEGPWTALRRTARGFLTTELPGVRLRVEVGGASTDVVSDADGYLRAELEGATLVAPWTTGRVVLAAPYRGIEAGDAAVRVRVSDGRAELGIISDVDDTLLQTGVQRTLHMVRQTLTGSELTRATFPGAPELYRGLARPDERNPIFYVSSSPWNLHEFLLGFLRHRDFPAGPVLLRDLVTGGHKHERIEELLRVHADLRFVLLGDSGEHDPAIYAETVRRHPGRVLAVGIREVRLDVHDGTVEAAVADWDADVPFVLAADSLTLARRLAELGLVDEATVAAVAAASR